MTKTGSAVVNSAAKAGDGPAAADRPQIRVTGLRKHFRRRDGELVTAIDGIDLDVAPGEFLVLLGPSGCGKTTLLRSLAGLEVPDAGSIEINGKTVFDGERRMNLAPEKRGAGMLFQSYALWPHMTVGQNVAYPLKGVKKAEARERVRDVLALVNCGGLIDQYPGEISGGQQQRIALARALVADDRVIFFDEPLSNIDAQLRESLRTDLRILQRRLGFSAIYVTHDQSEALALGDRIAILDSGRIAQLGGPIEVYRKPASAYVARFMGSLNEYRGSIERDSSGTRVVTGIGSFPAREPDRLGGISALAAFRPSAASITAPDEPDSLKATVIDAQFQGTYSAVRVDIAGESCVVWARGELDLAPGDVVGVRIPWNDALLFPDEDGAAA